MKLEPNLQKGGNDFLYVESKRARLEREKVSVLKISKHVSNLLNRRRERENLKLSSTLLLRTLPWQQFLVWTLIQRLGILIWRN